MGIKTNEVIAADIVNTIIAAAPDDVDDVIPLLQLIVADALWVATQRSSKANAWDALDVLSRQAKARLNRYHAHRMQTLNDEVSELVKKTAPKAQGAQDA